MDDMNAKELFEKSKRLTEADSPVPPEHPLGVPPKGREYPPMPGRQPLKMTGRMRAVPFHPPGSEMGEEEDMPPDVARMTGREAAPKGQFNPKELSQLKDVVIMILANLAHSDLDAQIGQALMSGQELDPGQLQHILDEARNVQIPETHGALLQKIFTRLGQR